MRETKNKNNELGITLISLVVTIIVLLILSGITLTLVMGQNGIIAKAQYAKIQSEISGEKEQLSMAVSEATLDNTGKQATLDQIKNKIIEKDITTEENIKVGSDKLQVTTPKGHTYSVDQNGNVDYVTDGTVIIPNLTESNVTFTYTPNSWVNDSVQVAITTTVKQYTLQCSMDGSTWNTYTNPITFTNNGTIYVRLWDGINYGGSATGNVANIDKTSPTLVLNQDSNIETRTITINATDTQSGINLIQYNNGGTWQNLTTNSITNGKSATYSADENETYAFRTIDNAGNITSQNIVVAGMLSQVGKYKSNQTVVSSIANTAIKDDNGNVVTIPVGFKIASDSATKQEDGIVIEDKDGNQFVWIPVANISDYARSDFGRYWTGQSFNDFIETMPSDEQTSVNTYHGYYIGRYEVGDSVSTANKVLRNNTSSNTNAIAVKKGQAPYNMTTRDESINLIGTMQTTEGYKAKEKLCSSYAWDTALRFIQNKVPNYGSISDQGNYVNTTLTYTDITGVTQTKALNDTVLIPTGQTTPLCNIYDMGGNDWEWTTEITDSSDFPCVTRGGGFETNSSTYAAGYRGGNTISSYYANVGFRPTLYM